MTIQAATEAAGGRPIQRIAWVNAEPCWWNPPDWALMWCPGGCPAIMPREGVRVRYCLTWEEVDALDWRVVPQGKEGVVLAFVAAMGVDS